MATEPVLALASSTLKPIIEHFKDFLRNHVKAAGTVAHGAVFESFVFEALQVASTKERDADELSTADTGVFQAERLFETLHRINQLITCP